MNNKVKLAALGLILTVLTVGMIQPTTVNAFTTMPPTVPSSLTLWDWRGYAYCANTTQYYGTGSGAGSCGTGALTTPNDKVQYVVYRQPNDNTNHQVQLAVNNSQCLDLGFYNVGGVSYLGNTVRSTFGTKPAGYCTPSWGAPGTRIGFTNYTFKDGSPYVNTAVGGATTNLVYVGALSPITQIDGVQTAYNAYYDSNYQLGRFSGLEVPYTAQGALTTCSTFDVGCKITSAMSTVTDTIKDTFTGALNVIASLYMPNSDVVKSDFDSFNSFLSAKLGFLVYPLQFIGNMFSSLTSGADWCTQTSCSKNFGNFYGKPFTLNFLGLKAIMPSYWSWFCLLVQGLTVFELIIMIRRKYMGVIAK